MKTGRNDPCPCGSGKKFKHCCINAVSKQLADVTDSLEQVLAMNPDLTLDELNVVAQHHMQARNEGPDDDFCGLSPAQMSNWLYAPFSEIEGLTISVPEDLSASPVMRYLDLMLSEMVAQGGSIKATSKGNLPVKLVKQASELLPEFAVAEFEVHLSISEFAGSNEDKFNALHYTRLLADIAGIIYLRSGKLHIKKSALKLYQQQGVAAFFLPMLEAAMTGYNWAYMDGFQDDIRVDMFWVFMLWRLYNHNDVERLIEEVCTAFPALVDQMEGSDYRSPESSLGLLIEVRFLSRCLQYWGFVTLESRKSREDIFAWPLVHMQPLLRQTFDFSLK